MEIPPSCLRMRQSGPQIRGLAWFVDPRLRGDGDRKDLEHEFWMSPPFARRQLKNI